MKINTAYYTAIGSREKNEDAISINECNDRVLAVVCDGLGGHAGGEIASKMAINTIVSELGQEEIGLVVFRDAITKANEAIYSSLECADMKTTVAALWFDSKSGFVATVGDTRLYQFRDGEIIFQSRDHSVVQMSILAGEMQPEDLRDSSVRNRLIRALGAEESVKVDITELDIKEGDAFLLCSDGFWGNVWEADMVSMLATADNSTEWLQNMKRLVEKKQTSKSDNHSAIAIIVEGGMA